MGVICVRFHLFCLHALIFLAAGFFCLYSHFSNNNSTTCVPNLVDDWGHLIQFKNGLPILCYSLVYGMGAVSALNLLTCALNSCLLKYTCIAFLNSLLTTVYLAYSVLGSSVVTVYYIVWCDVLQQLVVNSNGCDDAAVRYDSYNTTAQMSFKKSRMEIQMISLWTLFALSCLALLTSLIAFQSMVTDDNDREGNVRYIVLQSESTPLLSPVNRSPSVSRSSIAGNNLRTDSLDESTSQRI